MHRRLRRKGRRDINEKAHKGAKTPSLDVLSNPVPSCALKHDNQEKLYMQTTTTREKNKIGYSQ
jgi:hypothetical protein